VPESTFGLRGLRANLLPTERNYGAVTILHWCLTTSHRGRSPLQGLPPFSYDIGGTMRNAVREVRT
jgi:hypothetical protein